MESLQEKITKLKLHQKDEVNRLISRFIEHNRLNPLSIVHDVRCPHCKSTEHVKNGVTCGRQRYKCKDCGKTYAKSTLTSVHKLQKIDKWTDFIYLMFNSGRPLTLKELSEKLGITPKTVHTWKHKLLASLNQQDEIKLSGKIEMDEVFLPFNVKGRKGKEKTSGILEMEKGLKGSKQKTMFLCIHNRNNDFDFQPIKIQQRGQVSSEDIQKIVETLNIKKNTTIITDKSKGLTKYFTTRTDVTHQTFMSKGEKTDVLHNNYINNVMSSYKSWSKDFRGYSTKYIWNYLKWFRYMRKFTYQSTIDTYVQSSVKDTEGYTRYNDIPKYYEEFLKSA